MNVAPPEYSLIQNFHFSEKHSKRLVLNHLHQTLTRQLLPVKFDNRLVDFSCHLWPSV
jgi:hypothetical protein